MQLDQIHEADVEGVIALTIVTAQILGRSIPDHWGGVLGFIRRVAKVIGLYNGYGGKPNDSVLEDSQPAEVAVPADWRCPDDCPHRLGKP